MSYLAVTLQYTEGVTSSGERLSPWRPMCYNFCAETLLLIDFFNYTKVGNARLFKIMLYCNKTLL